MIEPWIVKLQTRRLYNGAKHGNVEWVRDSIRLGADARRITNRMRRTSLILACGGMMPSLAVVRELLGAGVDVAHRDITGRNALEWARLRLEQMGPWTMDELPSRSPSLDEHGNLRLLDFEQEALDHLREENPDIADDFIKDYMEGRREVALQQFNPRAEYDAIIPELERAMGQAHQAG